ncbi:MAG: GerMN domain-containing protein [Acidobacteria bacterium]|nr:GerMN domain-containing protein [Acidobacteriota bacterium]
MSRRSLTVAAITASALVLVAALLGLQLLSEPPAPEGASPAPQASPATAAPPQPTERRIRTTLYFLANSGKTLVAEEREIAFSPSLQEQVKQVVRELLAGSRRGLASPFPTGVVLRDVFISPQGLAFVDLSQELVANHPGGSETELLTVYSLANTLTANFPAVTKVQLLVEGREVESLAGHLDLTIPYGRGPAWILGSSSPPGP